MSKRRSALERFWDVHECLVELRLAERRLRHIVDEKCAKVTRGRALRAQAEDYMARCAAILAGISSSKFKKMFEK